ncbi:hypothetical protein B0H14DRAFT_2564942 [Mycena olivaceomarginata]|nr:hypothetical protein B0H14DRAFT_2564942 [Mycena olivaceomarginata]
MSVIVYSPHMPSTKVHLHVMNTYTYPAARSPPSKLHMRKIKIKKEIATTDSNGRRLYGTATIFVPRIEALTYFQGIKNPVSIDQKNETLLHKVLVTDGENRRAAAFVKEYMKRPLSPESPIYPQLSGLEMMNFMVGDDDITPDKDAKHVLKCLRGLLLRDAGIETVWPSRTINTWLNPYDRQHIMLSFSFLRGIWSLPDAPPGSSPTFTCAQQALKIFGKLGYYLIMPYIGIDLDLSTQLTYLSAAAHLLLDLYVHNNARTRFMPIQTFVNLMIKIKNAYFCVAKTKVDIPEGKFWLILLGTDRLEVFFGLIRTAVGTDANVELLQLASRSSGLCEVAVIMVLYPEWDSVPRRLALPPVSEAGVELDSKFDHLNPLSWRGNVNVDRVTLLTTWIKGRQLVEDFLPGSAARFAQMADDPRVNILAPFGKPLYDEPEYENESMEESYQSLELEKEYAESSSSPIATPDSEPSYARDDDLEDAMAVEEPRGGFDAFMSFNGTRVSKAKALRLAMAGVTGVRASTDRIKRVASIPCYGTPGIYDSERPILGEPCLRIDNPICTLVRCDAQLFLAIGAVNTLVMSGEKVDHIPLYLLVDSESRVSFQIMSLVRTTVVDDPSQSYDWRWSNRMDTTCTTVPGRLVQPLNPTLSVRIPEKPTYLFESSELRAYGASLLERFSAQDLQQNIPVVKRTDNFPYRFQGKACFLCEHDTNGRPVDTEPGNLCSHCKPPLEFILDVKHAPRVIEHSAAHLLHDPSIHRNAELCGLCLCPAPMCTFYLRKTAGGGYQVDWDKSTCLYKIPFQYAVASVSTAGSPCSNVPVICPSCGPKKLAVWKYNLGDHFRNHHGLHNPAVWPVNLQLTDVETNGLARIWESRKVQKQPRKKKAPRPLEISEAHSSRLAFR